MRELGLPERLVRWIMKYITIVSYKILGNGVSLKPFKAEKGLRQGDPMSPYLFAIAMEYLSTRLYGLKITKGFKYHPKCKRKDTIALLFSDDLLIISYVDVKSIRLIQQDLEEFSVAFGLFANCDKSVIYNSSVSDEVQQEQSRILKIYVGSLPFRYLGVPLSHNKLTVAYCIPP